MNATLARLTRLAVDLSHESDARLLDGFLAGSQPAFRELVYRHGPLVYAVCQRVLRHRQDAEDAFQAVFLVLARRAADVWPRDAVGSWLYGVASRVAMKARTSRTRRTARLQPLEDVPQPDAARPEPDSAEIIERVIRKLPEVYRAAVIACDLEGLSRREAAGQLGWSEGTLSGRLARARKLLADRLRKAGITLPAGGLAIALGTTAPVRAGLEETVVELVSGHAAIGVSAPVAALAEGVVSSMGLFKLKAIAAVMLVTGAVGYGAWAAGSGDGPGTATLAPSAAQGQPKKPAVAEPPKLSPALQLLQGRWKIVGTSDGIPGVVRGLEMEITGATLVMPYYESGNFQKRRGYKIAVDDTQNPKTIDVIVPGQPVGRGVYEFTDKLIACAACHQTSPKRGIRIEDEFGTCKPARAIHTGMRLAIALEGPRPSKFGGDNVVVFNLERIRVKAPDTTEPDAAYQDLKRQLDVLQADDKKKDQAERVRASLQVLAAKIEEQVARKELAAAQVQLDQAKAAAAVAQAQLDQAGQRLSTAQRKLVAAEYAAERAAKADAPAPRVKDGEAFTVHVRPLAAAEKVIRVKASNQSVLEGLAYAAEDMALKADALTVWVVRGKEILPVDLAALHNGVTQTNYILKPGDRLFVQSKLTK